MYQRIFNVVVSVIFLYEIECTHVSTPLPPEKKNSYDTNVRFPAMLEVREEFPELISGKKNPPESLWKQSIFRRSLLLHDFFIVFLQTELLTGFKLCSDSIRELHFSFHFDSFWLDSQGQGHIHHLLFEKKSIQITSSFEACTFY